MAKLPDSNLDSKRKLFSSGAGQVGSKYLLPPTLDLLNYQNEKSGDIQGCRFLSEIDYSYRKLLTILKAMQETIETFLVPWGRTLYNKWNGTSSIYNNRQLKWRSGSISFRLLTVSLLKYAIDSFSCTCRIVRN